jgi:predicted outer membrane protein
MKAWIPLTLVIALGAAAHAQADCTYPNAPGAIPDGSTASKDEMIAAKNDVARYNNEMNAYLDCIKLEIQAATPKDPSKLSKDDRAKAEEQEKMLTQKNNAAVDELQGVVGRFNEQLKIWKAKHAS